MLAAPPTASIRRMLTILLTWNALTFLAHGVALRGWWLNDDTQILVHVVRESPWSVLFSREAWSTLSTSSFTPLVTISFGMDFAIAGLTPWFFYAHQLAAIGTAFALLYLLLRRFVNRPEAAFAAALGLASPITVVVARSLMLRHYAEGLLLSVLALLLFDLACDLTIRRRTQALALAASLVAYVLAVLAKEFYIPLPALFVLLCLARRLTVREMVLKLVPAATAAFVALGWRTFMLGGFGGYSPAGTDFDHAAKFQSLLLAPFGGASAFAWIGLGAVAVVLLGGMLINPSRAAIVAILVTIFVLAPLAGTADVIQARYAWVAAVTFSSLVGLAAASWKRRWIPAVAVLLVGAVVVQASVKVASELETVSRRASSEGKYVFSGPSDGAALLAQSAPWYLTGLAWLRVHHEKRDAPPVFFFTLVPVATHEAPDRVLVARDDGSLEPLPAAERQRSTNEAERQRELPMTVTASMKGSVFQWSLGPWQAARWTFLTWPYYAAYPIPAEGARRVPVAYERQWFRIRADFPDGTWTISDVLEVPPEGKAVRWARP